MTKCGDLGEISNRNLQLGEIDLKEHTYHSCIDISSDLNSLFNHSINVS